MDSQTTTSESPITGSSVVTKGFAQIALGAAAGAFVAMRINRSALLLTAGLAYAYWKKNQPTNSHITKEYAVEPNVEDESDLRSPSQNSSIAVVSANGQPPQVSADNPYQWTTRPSVLDSDSLPSSSLQPFFTAPVSLIEPEVEMAVAKQAADTDAAADTEVEMQPAPTESAWADLRAAIAPIIPSSENEKSETIESIEDPSWSAGVDDAIQAVVSSAPPMLDLHVCVPSSPMVLPTLEESTTLSSDMLMIEQEVSDQEETPESLFFDAPAELVPTPQSLGFTETLIVPRPKTQPLFSEAPPNDKNLSAPVVLPRDLQAKKSFFDWLRG